MDPATRRRAERRGRLAAIRAEVAAIRDEAARRRGERAEAACARRQEAESRAAHVAEFLDEGCRRPRARRAAEDEALRVDVAAARRLEVADMLEDFTLRRHRAAQTGGQERRAALHRRRTAVASFCRTSTWFGRQVRAEAQRARRRELCELFAAVERLTGVRRREPCDACRDDDLEIIYGIGPKCARLLKSAGVQSFIALAAMSPASLRSLLRRGGSNLRSVDPTTWPEQAQLAANGDANALRALQATLIGGRRPRGD